ERMVLITDGFDVETATGGREALEKLKSRRYDGIVLDMRMPDIDGCEVVRQLQSVGLNKRTKPSPLPRRIGSEHRAQTGAGRTTTHPHGRTSDPGARRSTPRYADPWVKSMARRSRRTVVKVPKISGGKPSWLASGGGQRVRTRMGPGGGGAVLRPATT